MAKKKSLLTLFGFKPRKKRARRCFACGQTVPAKGAPARKRPAAKKATTRRQTLPRGTSAAYADVRRTKAGKR